MRALHARASPSIWTVQQHGRSLKPSLDTSAKMLRALGVPTVDPGR